MVATDGKVMDVINDSIGQWSQVLTGSVRAHILLDGKGELSREETATCASPWYVEGAYGNLPRVMLTEEYACSHVARTRCADRQ